ncbi:MAG: hypothetical protein COZ51_02925 [Candidatus Aquicultor secundus]|nr:MAG: hypothetical protein COZ51_02925 [Candidatus Aquicultor secundus]
MKTPTEISSNIKIALIVDYIFWIMVAVVLLRFAFKLIGANSNNAFVTLIYNFTNAFVGIFQGIVGNVISGTMVIEFSSLITIVIFWLIYKAALRLLAIMK